MAAAAGVHVLIFLGVPGFRSGVWEDGAPPRRLQTDAGDVAVSWTFVDVFFGPPQIVAADGTIWQEPPERVLEARQVEVGTLRSLSTECQRKSHGDMVPAEARVGIQLDAYGLVARASISESSGDPCRDQMITAIARSVWYHWIPNERFPAPVELIQPMRVVAALD